MADKKNNLNLVIEQIKKQTKDPNAIMRLGDGKKLIKDIEVISSGSISLNVALGIGGLPKGRIVEIYGPESSGKTTLTLHVIAEAQKAKGTAAFIDVEHAFIKIDNSTFRRRDFVQHSQSVNHSQTWNKLVK